MIYNTIKCKLCGRDIKYLSGSAGCQLCKGYSVTFDSDHSYDTELIQAGNFYLIYLVKYKVANVCQRNESASDTKKLSSIKIDELTSEIAVSWFRKLKNYLIFQ